MYEFPKHSSTSIAITNLYSQTRLQDSSCNRANKPALQYNIPFSPFLSLCLVRMYISIFISSTVVEYPSSSTNEGHPPRTTSEQGALILIILHTLCLLVQQFIVGVPSVDIKMLQYCYLTSYLLLFNCVMCNTFAAADMDRLLIQRHIQQQGSLNMSSHKVLLCGLPRTGKTTAMQRLSNQLRCLDRNDSPNPSTGFEKPQTVELYQKTVKQSVMIAGVHAGGETEWKYHDLEQQVQTLYSRILSSGAVGQSLLASKDTEDVFYSPSSMALDDLQALLTSLVKAQDWNAVRERLKGIEDVTVLHMLDCGGHPECHEILPLLLEGRALSLIFLNLTHDLDKTYQVVFRGKDGPSSIEYESVFTAREVLQYILCSISSLQSKEKPVALLVGSYLDETNQEAVLTLEKSVQDALKGFIKKDILFPANVQEGKYIATLDNMSEDQGDVEELRKMICTIIETRLKSEPIPTSWLMLHLLLRAKYEKEPGWCTLEECVKLARACGIKEELLGILCYIHNHYGTLLYYPKVAGLCSKVICDPNIILHPFTRTFLFSFACNPGHTQTAMSIRATGEIPPDLMDTICANESANPIPTSEIVALLKDRYILYESVDSAKGTRSYFMPCLLHPDPSVVKEASSPTTLSTLDPAPLLLVPEHSTGYVPLGLFPALVVKMSHIWDLKRGERFRNRITFKVIRKGKPTRRVEFRHHPSYLELRLLHTSSKRAQQEKDLSILTSCRQQLWEALCQVSSEYPHMKDVVWQFGFYCPGGLQPGGQPHSAVCLTKEEVVEIAPVDMECYHEPCCIEEDFLLEDKHKSWFKVS